MELNIGIRTSRSWSATPSPTHGTRATSLASNLQDTNITNAASMGTSNGIAPQTSVPIAMFAPQATNLRLAYVYSPSLPRTPYNNMWVGHAQVPPLRLPPGGLTTSQADGRKNCFLRQYNPSPFPFPLTDNGIPKEPTSPSARSPCKPQRFVAPSISDNNLSF